MCGPQTWWCPICAGGESQNSDYVTMGSNTSHEYRWSCRQYVCCFLQCVILLILCGVVFGGVIKGSNGPANNSTNSSSMTYFNSGFHPHLVAETNFQPSWNQTNFSWSHQKKTKIEIVDHPIRKVLFTREQLQPTKRS